MVRLRRLGRLTRRGGRSRSVAAADVARPCVRPCSAPTNERTSAVSDPMKLPGPLLPRTNLRLGSTVPVDVGPLPRLSGLPKVRSPNNCAKAGCTEPNTTTVASIGKICFELMLLSLSERRQDRQDWSWPLIINANLYLDSHRRLSRRDLANAGLDVQSSRQMPPSRYESLTLQRDPGGIANAHVPYNSFYGLHCVGRTPEFKKGRPERTSAELDR